MLFSKFNRISAFNLTEHHTDLFFVEFVRIQKSLNFWLLIIIDYDPPLQIVFVCQSVINNLNFIKYLTTRVILKDYVRSTFDRNGPSRSNYLT